MERKISWSWLEVHVGRVNMIICDRIWKIDHLETRTEIHLLPVRDRHTHALSRNTKH